MLVRLPPRDLALLAPHLERVSLRREQMLYDAGDLVSYVFFPEPGTLVGLFAPVTGSASVKVAAVDGTCALALVEAVDHRRALARGVVVLPGPALRVAARDFAAAARRSEPIRGTIRRTAEMLIAEMMRNVACNAVHTAEQRVARWLLTAHGLVRDEAHPEKDAEVELPLTQERLGDMLGLQRTTVTVVAGRLQAAGVVRYARGRLRVCDRAGLSRIACDCNEAIAEAHRRLMA